LFTKGDLIEHFEEAGFQETEFAESYPEYGILCEPWSRGLVARKTVRRPPWAPPPPAEPLPPDAETAALE
jgi:hypothetical protein